MDWRKQSEEDVDYWVDHTTVTSFEELSKKLEKEILQLESSSTINGDQEDVTISIFLNDSNETSIRLRRSQNTYALIDFSKNDARASFASRWFGVNTPYFTIFDTKQTLDRNEAQRLLSALSIALGNTHCFLPCFVSFQSTSHQSCFLGYSIDGIYFESEVEGSTMTSNLKLEDFQRLFRNTYSFSKNNKISIRLTWNSYEEEEDNGNKNKRSLLKGIRSSAVFPLSPEGVFFDNQLFSTVTPEKASVWTFLAIWNSSRLALDSGPGAFEEDGENSVTMTPMSRGLTILMEIVDNGDERKRKGKHDFVQSLARKVRTSSNVKISDIASQIVNDAFSDTNSPLTSLALFILDLIGNLTYIDLEEIKLYVSAIWNRFTSQLRGRFERKDTTLFSSCDEIGLEPDLSRCLAHQKVTLIRFCTKILYKNDDVNNDGVRENDPYGRKKELDFFLSNSSPKVKAWEPLTQQFHAWGVREDDNDRMESCPSPLPDLLTPNLVSDMSKKPISFSLILTGKIGAFKAANLPNECEFVDFLRWYSPKDVANDSQVSERMSTGNVWINAWNKSKPIKASKQAKRLFDPVTLGEKALHYLETLNFEQTLQTIISEGFVGFRAGLSSDKEEQELSKVHELFANIEAKKSRIEALKRSKLVSTELIDLLVTGDGMATVVNNTKILTEISRHRPQQPDKREYLILGENGERLYSSTMVGETRSARVLRIS